MFSSDQILEEANSVKVLAFMEIAPLTDKFQQIVLTEKQAQQMRDSLFRILSGVEDEKQEFNQFDVTTNDDIEIILPNVRDAYGQEFINKAKESTESE